MGGIIIAGFGFRASADLVSLTNAFEKAADGLTVAFYAVDTETITATDTATRSAIVLEKRQTGSVAEAAALALFNSPAKLICIRQISSDGRAACALATGESL